MKTQHSALLLGTAAALSLLSGSALAQAAETVLASFGSSSTDGSYPYQDLQGSDGNFYGVTDDGGANAGGTLFEYDVATATEAPLYSFGSAAGDGTYPLCTVQGSDGNLYGVAQTGGANGVGTLFEYKVAAGSESTLAAFGSSGTDGGYPYALIQGSDGNFYGVAQIGGANGEGTVFEYNVTTASEITLASFGSSAIDGTDPLALIQGKDGNLYGVTQLGGANNQGTLFEYNVASATERVLASFGASSTDGAQPVSLLQGSDGNFYGVTQLGGTNGDGAIFEYDVAGGGKSILASFGSSASDGIRPVKLIQGSDGNLYGVTQLGGANSSGTAFEYLLPGGPEAVLAAFGSSSTDGVGPHDLIQGKDGNFYGVTQLGGADGNLGSFFELLASTSPDSNSDGGVADSSSSSGESGGGAVGGPEIIFLFLSVVIALRSRRRSA